MVNSLVNMEKYRCRTCKKPAPRKANPFFPFCSERCKLIDLGKWASEQYRIAGEPVKKEKEPDEEN